MGLVLLGLTLTACSREHPPRPQNVLRYPMAAEPTTLDPGRAQDGDTISILAQVYEGLVAWNEQNKVGPAIASSWDVSSDQRTYTFNLRTDARFSNGRPVTAKDFKWCFERNCRPGFGSQTARRFLTDIVGAADMIAGKRPDIPGLVAVKDTTLSITIDRPRAYFLEKLTLPVAYVFDKEALPDPDKEMANRSEMVGSGPFRFLAVEPEQEIDLAANSGYHDGRPRLDKIERPYIPDAPTRLVMYRRGSLDFIRLERQDVAAVQEDPVLSKQVQLFPRPALWYFGINSSMTPGFDKPEVRRAVAMAIDRNRIVKDVLEGVNPIAPCIVPPGVFGHRNGEHALPYNPAAARQALAAAGYPGGKGLPEVQIWYRNNRPDMKLLAEAIGQDLARNLGLEVSFKASDYGQLLGALNRKQVPFVALRWSADFLDAEDFLSGLLSSGSAGDTLDYHNPEFDLLCGRADVSTDPAERERLYGQAEDIALHDAPVVPICFEQDAELISPRVHGIRNSLIWHLAHTGVVVW